MRASVSWAFIPSGPYSKLPLQRPPSAWIHFPLCHSFGTSHCELRFSCSRLCCTGQSALIARDRLCKVWVNGTPGHKWMPSRWQHIHARRPATRTQKPESSAIVFSFSFFKVIFSSCSHLLSSLCRCEDGNGPNISGAHETNWR